AVAPAPTERPPDRPALPRRVWPVARLRMPPAVLVTSSVPAVISKTLLPGCEKSRSIAPPFLIKEPPPLKAPLSAREPAVTLKLLLPERLTEPPKALVPLVLETVAPSFKVRFLERTLERLKKF